MTNDERVPKCDGGQEIATELDKLQQRLETEKFAQVKALANRFYEVNRRVLDMAHDRAIITDLDYKECLVRGNEFSPVGWITEN
jgi:hypothetical protein